MNVEKAQGGKIGFSKSGRNLKEIALVKVHMMR